MSVTVQVSQIVDRPIAPVFNFFATNHITNHPRWDPDIELERVSDEPIGVGTVIRRRNSRSGTPVEGTMLVTEYDLNRAFATKIQDGPVEILGRAVFEAVEDHRTRITTTIEFPDMDESTDMSFLLSRLERSGELRKSLIEAEL